MWMRAALAFLLALASTPLASCEAVFPGNTWEMLGANRRAGWDAERLRAALLFSGPLSDGERLRS